jgi:hypothetical protein
MQKLPDVFTNVTLIDLNENLYLANENFVDVVHLSKVGRDNVSQILYDKSKKIVSKNISFNKKENEKLL